MLSVKQGSIKYHFFLVFGLTRPGIEPRSHEPLVNPTDFANEDFENTWTCPAACPLRDITTIENSDFKSCFFLFSSPL